MRVQQGHRGGAVAMWNTCPAWRSESERRFSTRSSRPARCQFCLRRRRSAHRLPNATSTTTLPSTVAVARMFIVGVLTYTVHFSSRMFVTKMVSSRMSVTVPLTLALGRRLSCPGNSDAVTVPPAEYKASSDKGQTYQPSWQPIDLGPSRWGGRSRIKGPNCIEQWVTLISRQRLSLRNSFKTQLPKGLFAASVF